ncbi:hypothetical protein BDD12DRAFT_367565 [Trichophaea hybrida]|nr:hypothetical protein BDD12DRAFT_367565 [Trichophaea hybrida]
MNSSHELVNSQSESGSSVVCAKLRDDLGRFRVWTGNAGAHRRNRQSLDHRLREASKVKSMVLMLLKDLYDNLQNAIAEFLAEQRATMANHGPRIHPHLLWITHLLRLNQKAPWKEVIISE